MRIEVSQTVAARYDENRIGERKVRAPQSGMLGNAQTPLIRRAKALRRRREQGHRDESLPVTRERVKRGNLHPEQHQVSGR